MPGDRIFAVAHELAAPAIAAGDLVMDATAGRGQDTAWLAGKVGPHGRVWAIDKQASAIESTRAHLTSLGLLARVQLEQRSHEQLLQDKVDWRGFSAVMLNLGYLPGGDKQICTRVEHTTLLIPWILQRLRAGGRMVCCVYPGHPQGAQESAALKNMAATLCPSTGTSWTHHLAQRGEHCPWIWTVQRCQTLPQ